MIHTVATRDLNSAAALDRGEAGTVGVSPAEMDGHSAEVLPVISVEIISYELKENVTE